MESRLLPEDKDEVGVYLVVNKFTDETYVGSGKLNECVKRHISGFNNGNHKNINVRNAFSENPDGWEFIPIPIKEPDLNLKENRELAYDIEQEIIDEFYGKTELFLNIAKNARDAYCDISEETRNRMSVAGKGRKQSPDHVEKRISQLRGRSVTEEVRASMSECRLGKPPPPEVLAAAIRANTGKHLSKEHKEKISKSNTGKKMSSESIEKSRQAHLGKKHSPEHIEKCRLSRIGTKRTPEQKERMKLASLARTDLNDVAARTTARNNKPITYDGVSYESIKSASEILGIEYKTFYNLIKKVN